MQSLVTLRTLTFVETHLNNLTGSVTSPKSTDIHVNYWKHFTCQNPGFPPLLKAKTHCRQEQRISLQQLVNLKSSDVQNRFSLWNLAFLYFSDSWRKRQLCSYCVRQLEWDKLHMVHSEVIQGLWIQNISDLVPYTKNRTSKKSEVHNRLVADITQQ